MFMSERFAFHQAPCEMSSRDGCGLDAFGIPHQPQYLKMVGKALMLTDSMTLCQIHGTILHSLACTKPVQYDLNRFSVARVGKAALKGSAMVAARKQPSKEFASNQLLCGDCKKCSDNCGSCRNARPRLVGSRRWTQMRAASEH